MSASGIWRDEDCLIVQPANAVLPDICVKSGAPAGGNRKTVIVGEGVTKLTWKEIAAVSAAAAVAKTVAGSSAKHAVLDKYGPQRIAGFALDVPVSEAFLAQWKKRSIRGWGLMILGIGGFVVLCFVYAVAMVLGASDAATDWMLYCMTPLPIVGLVGAGYLYAFQQPILTGERLSESYVRLYGVHPSVMEQFPPCPE